MKPSLSVSEQKLVAYQQVIASAEREGSGDVLFDTQPDEIRLVAVVLVRDRRLAATLKHYLICHPDIHQVSGADEDALMHVQADEQPLLFSDACGSRKKITNAYDVKPFTVALGDSNADALAAFRDGAKGFILTPLNESQVMTVLNHITTTILEHERLKRVGRLLDTITKKLNIAACDVPTWITSHLAQQNAQRIAFRSENAWCTLACDDIHWVQAAGDYMCIYTSSENYVVRTTLTDLCRKLCPKLFERVNRSELVNRHFVKNIEQHSNRSAYLLLQDGTRLKISRRYLSSIWQYYK